MIPKIRRDQNLIHFENYQVENDNYFCVLGWISSFSNFPLFRVSIFCSSNFCVHPFWRALSRHRPTLMWLKLLRVCFPLKWNKFLGWITSWEQIETFIYIERDTEEKQNIKEAVFALVKWNNHCRTFPTPCAGLTPVRWQTWGGTSCSIIEKVSRHSGVSWLVATYWGCDAIDGRSAVMRRIPSSVVGDDPSADGSQGFN